MSKQRTIRSVYFNPRETGSYSSLYEFLKNNKIKNLKDVENELSKLKTYVLFKPARKHFKTRRYFCYKFGDLWGADLLDLSKFSRQNKGMKFLLIVMECLSRKVYAVGIKSKHAHVVLEAFQGIVRDAGYTPKLLHTDEGKEFYGSFKKYLDSIGTKLYHTFTDKGSMLVERFNRWIRLQIYKIMSHNRNKVWFTHLDNIIFKYNHKVHSKTLERPVDVSSKNEEVVFNRLYKGYAEAKKIRSHRNLKWETS